ncbi:MAG: transposase [Selenomonadaceae bacterium]|nr:transposase [Selenomonadaceae bacterium]
MQRGYKVEIEPTPQQALKIRQSIGICRWLYNQYLADNFEIYDNFGKGLFETAFSYDKYVNHVLKEKYEWIKQCGAKARKQALINAEKAFKNFFEGKADRPKFKKKREQKDKAYFPKNNKGDWTVRRHKIQVPTIGLVKLKEKGYIPTKAKISGGTISYKARRYYVSVTVEITDKKMEKPQGEGIGIDLGIKELAVMSNGVVKPNINKTPKVKKVEKKLKREQRCLSRKYKLKKKKRGEKTATYSANIEKQVVRIQRLYQRLTNIRVDYENKIISEIVKREPRFIVLEDLNVSGMMKNKHLSKAIAAQRFYYFRMKLTIKSKERGIEVRIADRFYPSSKKCSQCGKIKKELKLKDRMYRCECGLKLDRDLNAAINLKNAPEYEIA